MNPNNPCANTERVMNIKHLEVKRAYYNDPENVVVQMSCDGKLWITADSEPDWSASKYRIKPKTIRIGDIDVPEPVRKPLKNGTLYYIPAFDTESPLVTFEWTSVATDIRVLSRGLIHLTPEAAELHAKALILVSGGSVE